MRALFTTGLLAALALPPAAPAAASVVINEIMYNAPGGADPAFVELHNAGAAPIDVGGWTLLDDNDSNAPCPLSGTIPAGGYLVVAESIATFQSVYPGAGPLNPTSYAAGQPDGGFLLGKGGDEVRLFDAGGALVDRVAYDDEPPWPTAADGAGSSLELINPALDNALAASWAASPAASPPGTPGAVNDSFDDDVPPGIRAAAREPLLPTADAPVLVTATVDDDLDVPAVRLLVDDGAGWNELPMLDDGLSGDGAAGDGVHGASLPPRPDGTVVRYYLEATDGAAQTTRLPAAAPSDWFGYTVGHRPPLLVIHELVASNQNGIPDQLGDRDDWLEIRNADVESVDLGGLFLSDDPDDPRRWALPAFQLPPWGHALIWCDAEPAQGPSHAPFTLPREGGWVGVFDAVDRGNTLIDGVEFPPQTPDVAFGFLPDDGDRREYIATPTPAASNAGAAPFADVVINELLSSSGVGTSDFIELVNRGSTTVDLGGWHLSDDPGQLTRFAIPAGTLLAPGELVAFDAEALGFGIASEGEPLLLTLQNEVTVVDAMAPIALPPDVSHGRLPDGGTERHLFSAWSRGLPNACPAGATTPGPVEDLRFDSRLVLRWQPAADADAHDVVVGSLAALRASGAADDVVCHENNTPQPATFVAEPLAPGEGRYFLVRGVTGACGFGSYSSGGPGEGPSRDVAIDAGDGCP